MGEMTSKYDGMSAARLAATLSPAMISALDTGRNDSGTAGVLGHANTIAALIDRDLVTVGPKHQWTDRGFRVAAFVLHGKVPARPHAATMPEPVAELDEQAAHAEATELLSRIAVDGRPSAVTELLNRAELLTDCGEHLRLVRMAVELDEQLRPAARPVTPGPERTTHVGTLGLRSCADEGCPGCTPEEHAAEAAAARRFRPDEHVLTPTGLNGVVTQTYDDGRLVEVSLGDSRTTYPAEYLRLRRLIALDGRRFEIGDVVRWKSEPDGVLWRVTSLVDHPAHREAYAVLEAIDDDKPGRAAGRLSLLAHVDLAAAKVVEQPPAAVSVPHAAIDLLRQAGELIAAAQQPPAAPETDPATDDSVSDLVDRIVRRSQYLALRELLDVLDGWVEGIRENAEQLDRIVLDDASTVLYPADVRRMVNDAARELGVPEPSKTDKNGVIGMPAWYGPAVAKAAREFSTPGLDVGPQFKVGDRVYPRSGGEVLTVERVAEIEGSGGRQQFWSCCSAIPLHSDDYQVVR